VTTSVGLTHVAVGTGESAMHILRNADLAMYAAKQAGKGRYATFDADMSRALLHDLQLRKELAVAVAEDQFFLLYQPLYDLATDRLCGAEALVRWAHPSGVTLPPSAFLRHAETVTLMPALGQLLLRRACRETRAWLDRHPVEPDFFVSVNLSALQLADETLPLVVAALLDEHRLEPRHLLLEVTESALLEDVDAAAAVLSELVALGVRIALDDFGTGYSSLAHLHQLPVQVLKTDGSFVASLDQPDGDPGLVALVAEIGNSLGLVTVGEGVETVGQLEELRRLGYGIAQGYLLGRPGPMAAMREALVAPVGNAS
jgi:predicted signal transduction protein with EAL and GGDEF domain